MKASGIYQIQSKTKRERIYIGSAVNLYHRWICHLHDLRKNTHHSKKLQRHYNKYGEPDLLFEILLCCEKEDLIKQEQFFIDTLNPWFNICRTAGSQLRMVHTLEAKERIREASIRNGNKPPSWLGKHHSEESKKKSSKSNRGIQAGVNHPMFGKRHSELTIKKMRKAKLGNKSKLGLKISEETRVRMKIAWVNRKLKKSA